jgi:sugar transferase (PEP-CTERM system associated)
LTIPLLTGRVSVRSIVLVAFETVLILAAIATAAYVRLGFQASQVFLEDGGLMKMVIVAVVLQGCLYFADLYDLRVLADRRELFIRLIHALASASFLLAALYFWFPSLIIGRGVIMIATLLVITLVLGWRLMFEWLSRRVRARERLLLVGTSAAAVDLAREMFVRRHELGVEIIGFVDADPVLVGSPVINPGVIGTIDDIPSIVRARAVDRVVVSLADARGKLPVQKLLEMKLDGVTFDHLASVYEEYTGKIAVENLRPSWLIFSPGFKKSHLLSGAKRSLDVTLASLGFVLALPIMALVALAIRLTSPGAVLYHQQRVGQHGRIFTVHKFRSMRWDAEAETGPVWASKEGDARVTPIGSWLRRTRLDELPQLWNVLRGDMSLVGPRPERPEFVTDLTRQIPFYGQRHIVRPGLTGWAQVRYTYGATTEDALQKLQYDLFYIKNLSLALDLFVMASTVKTVVMRKGAA